LKVAIYDANAAKKLANGNRTLLLDVLSKYIDICDKYLLASPNMIGIIRQLQSFPNEDIFSHMPADDTPRNFFTRGLITDMIQGDPSVAYDYYVKARDHPLAIFMRGVHLRRGMGVDFDRAAAVLLYKQSADAGCIAAAVAYAKWRESQNSFIDAAYYYQLARLLGHNCLPALNHILSHHPLEAAPFGKWKPSKIQMRLFPAQVKNSLYGWLLVAHRLGKVPRYVRLLVCSFICTRNGWE